jgi:hypothetical protein
MAAPELHALHKRLVDANTQLHRDGQSPADRLLTLIALRHALRDLCVAAGAWNADLEQTHQAEVQALRKLGGQFTAAG